MACTSVQAQDAVSSLAEKVAGAQVSLEYLYVVEKTGVVNLHGSGHLLMQGASYFVEGDGLKVWCDGSERWTVDEAAKEAVVENTAGNDYLSVPMLMIARLPELFSWSSKGGKTLFNKKTSYDGHGVDVAATCYSLLPKGGMKSDFTGIDIYFDSASALLGAGIRLKDGSEIFFTVLSMSFVPVADLCADGTSSPDISSFSISASSFDPSYIITDLR